MIVIAVNDILSVCLIGNMLVSGLPAVSEKYIDR